MFLENLLFFAISTVFLLITARYWRNAKPYSLPKSIPSWFKVWFVTVQIFGVFVPLIALIWWGLWLNNNTVFAILISYFLMLGLQILAEFLSLRRFESVVWVMIPYLYVPYRVWQLYQGLTILEATPELMILRIILWINVAIWSINYCLNLIQLPLLFRWETEESLEKSSTSKIS